MRYENGLFVNMTTKEFIGRCVNGTISKARALSSVCFDGTHIYSYGTHYPLLVNVAGRWILNDRGYSHTTAKHIGWARDYADYVISLSSNMDGWGRWQEKNSDLTATGLLAEVDREIDQIGTELKNLSARAWKKRAELNDRLVEIRKTQAFFLKVK